MEKHFFRDLNHGLTKPHWATTTRLSGWWSTRVKNISSRSRTITIYQLREHLTSPLHHQLMSFSSLFFILYLSFLCGQDKKQLLQHSSHRHTSYGTIVFATTRQSAVDIAHSVFLIYPNLFFEVIMKNISPKARTIDLPFKKPLSPPLDHQLLTVETLFF